MEISKTHQATTILIHEVPEAEAWWGGVGSSDGAQDENRGWHSNIVDSSHPRSKMCAARRSVTARHAAATEPGTAAPPRDQRKNLPRVYSTSETLNDQPVLF